MIDVRVGSKNYRNIESYTNDKLDHMVQLADICITNYKNIIKNYPPDRMENYGKPFLKDMETVKQQIMEIRGNR